MLTRYSQALLEHDPGYANVSVLCDATANFLVPQKLDVIWTAQNHHYLHDSFMGPADVASIAGTKPAEFTESMQYFTDRTRFRSLCRRQGRQSYATVDRPRQSVAARQ
jgi:hypothetical protein